MIDAPLESRRRFLLATAPTGIALVGCAGTPHGARANAESVHGDDAEVTPGEDLMQEHGVLERILLIYGEAAVRIDQGRAFDVMLLASTAGIVRRFVEVIPAFRGVVGGAAYRELGEAFEDQEHERFGKDGFAEVVAEIAGLEATLRIADLASFTP